MSSPLDDNRRAWDENVRRGQRHTLPATPKELENPLAVMDLRGWLGDVRGKRMLCLAAGGGRHSALFGKAGAVVTVVDLSPAMLELDRKMAAELGLKIRVVEASMDDLSALANASFDIVVQPVSTCYVPDIALVYREVARVIVPDGIYMSQHKSPTSLQADVLPSARGFVLNEPYYRAGALPPSVAGAQHREKGTVEFLHRWEQLLGGLCRAGFVIEDAAEPWFADYKAAPGTFEHRSLYVPPYIMLKARRRNDEASESRVGKLWVP